MQPSVDAALAPLLNFDDAPPPALKLLLDFLDDQARALHVNNPRLLQRWKHNAVLHGLLMPIVEQPQRLLNIRLSLAEQNRYAQLFRHEAERSNTDWK